MNEYLKEEIRELKTEKETIRNKNNRLIKTTRSQQIWNCRRVFRFLLKHMEPTSFFSIFHFFISELIVAMANGKIYRKNPPF